MIRSNLVRFSLASLRLKPRAKVNLITKMAPIDFYYMAESPPCRLVEVVARMAGVGLNKHLINLAEKDQLKEDFVKLNPLHKVPFIVDGELKMNESRAIATYLVNRYMADKGTFYPEDPVERARIDELLQFDLNQLDGSARRLLRPRLFGSQKDLNPEDEKVLRDAVAYIENRLENNGGKKFILGDHLTLADVSLAISFSFIDCFDYDISEFKAVTKYIDNLKKSIPNYEEINKQPEENLRNFIKSKQEAK